MAFASSHTVQMYVHFSNSNKNHPSSPKRITMLTFYHRIIICQKLHHHHPLVITTHYTHLPRRTFSLRHYTQKIPDNGAFKDHLLKCFCQSDLGSSEWACMYASECSILFMIYYFYFTYLVLQIPIRTWRNWVYTFLKTDGFWCYCFMIFM